MNEVDKIYATPQIQIIQDVLLEIMTYLDAFCRKYNIKYSLGYGSLIGAIRHKGFIPWDDDIDIIVDRNNHNKMMSAIEQHGLGDYIFIKDLWIPRVAKEIELNGQRRHVWIDILTFDNKPDNFLSAKFKLIMIIMLQGMIKKSVNRSNSLPSRVVSYCLVYLGKLFPLSTKQGWYERISQIGNSTVAKYMKPYHGEFVDLINEEHKTEFFNEYIDVEFEGRQFMIIRDYDVLLRETFGDYMQLPPEDQRYPKHISNTLLER